MNINDAGNFAKKRAKQLGWETFGTEKKLFSVTTSKTISTGGDEFFILLTPDTALKVHTVCYQLGKIISERGSFMGSSLTGADKLDSNFEFAGNVKIYGIGEGSMLIPLLRVYRTKN